MAELTVDRVYGEALYQVAAETGKTEIIMEEGFAICDILEQEPDLERLLVNPASAAGIKTDITTNAFDG